MTASRFLCPHTKSPDCDLGLGPRAKPWGNQGVVLLDLWRDRAVQGIENCILAEPDKFKRRKVLVVHTAHPAPDEFGGVRLIYGAFIDLDHLTSKRRFRMRIQLIRNATLRLSFGQRTFLIDPWFAEKGQDPSNAGQVTSPLVDLPMPVAQILDGVDAVIISHLHTDHFDDTARVALPSDIPIFCGTDFAQKITEYGFSNVNPLTHTTTFGDISLSITQGRHGPEEILQEMGPVSGFVFRAPDEPTLYWAGDTILCDEVREVIETAHPDVIVVHACGAVWDGIEPLVMDADMTLETLRLSGSAKVVATHLDSINHATVSRQDLRNVAAKWPKVFERLSIPEDGDVLVYDNLDHNKSQKGDS
jgi:L-ascorbate metabolism protein UlaG (beta-lactamase superfamily)